MFPECYIFRGSQKHVNCFSFQSFGCERQRAMVNIIPETRHAHTIRCLLFY